MTLPLPRRPGATYALADVGFLDFETRSATADVRVNGAYAYACEADIVVGAYAIGGGPVEIAAVENFGAPLSWRHPALKALREHHKRVVAGKAIWCAWNAGFDRCAWNYSTADFPALAPTHIVDAMVQASAAGLPADLKRAARAIGGAQKDAAGRDLIKLFCLPGGEGTPQTHPEAWREFLNYAGADVEAMRSVWQATRQLPAAEWAEYFAMERINERGVGIDLQMVVQAARLAAEDKLHAAREIRNLTAGRVQSVDTVQQMTAWLYQVLPQDIRELLIESEAEIDEETGEELEPEQRRLRRPLVQRLIAYCQGKPHLARAERVLQIRLFGGSKTPAKFARMRASAVDGVLYGQYVFNGAGQTGRASSRGCQVHNLARDALPYELDAIDALRAGANYAQFAQVGGTTDPVARKLSLLIRPAFVPADGNVFVWSDWSQIEARILPWLANTPEAEARLDIFRKVDADPRKPDLYTRTAAILSKVAVKDVTKAMRQRGKVAELALGYGGGVRALLNMAAGYGLHLETDEARATVDAWREVNPWCVEFWGAYAPDGLSHGLWGAVNDALRAPGIIFGAGRIRYVFLMNYLGGSLLCVLPSGRCLTYRNIKYETVVEKDKRGRMLKVGSQLRFARGYGRVKLWAGMLAENCVQAVAADILRGTLVRLEREPVQLHTHDEVLLSVPLTDAIAAKRRLRAVMQQGFDWSKGLPLMSEETIGYCYSKSEAAHETEAGIRAVLQQERDREPHVRVVSGEL